MFIKMNDKSEKGFTLIELLITIAIIGTLAAIAIPLYISQQAKAYQTTAASDGRAWADNINSSISTATSLGTSAGTISLGTISNGQATITLTLTAPTGVTSPVTTTVAASAGDTMSGTTAVGTTNYCYIVTNNGQKAGFTQGGYQPGLITSCVAGVLS